MLRLFGTGSDHPMADAKEARRILQGLGAQEPLNALEEAVHWLESVSAAERFRPEARVRALLALDEAAQAHLRKLARDYFAAARPSRFQETRLWGALHGYYRQAGASLSRAVDLLAQDAQAAERVRAEAALLVVRALRNLAQQLKWAHLRYGPIEPTLYAALNRVYAFAEARQLASAQVSAYPGIAANSSPQREFLKAALFSAAGPDALLPAEIDLADRLIGHFAVHFTIGAKPDAAAPFWLDLAQPMAPRRAHAGLALGPGVRWLGAGVALAQIEHFVERLAAGGSLPQELAALAPGEPQALLSVLQHLARAWARQPPARGAARHAVKSRVAVIHGYDAVLAAFGGGRQLSFVAEGAEHWMLENVSVGGFGARVPQLKGDWLRVGALIALQPEGGDNWLIGIVRRVQKTGAREACVGIQTQAHAAAAERFRAGALTEEGLLVRGPSAGEARIVLAPGVYAPLQNLELERDGRTFVYIPQGIVARGEDYEIGRYREMVRES